MNQTSSHTQTNEVCTKLHASGIAMTRHKSRTTEMTIMLEGGASTLSEVATIDPPTLVDVWILDLLLEVNDQHHDV